MHWTMFCPKCKGTNMEFGELRPNEEIVLQGWGCRDCKAHGEDAFRISSRKVWDEAEKYYYAVR